MGWFSTGCGCPERKIETNAYRHPTARSQFSSIQMENSFNICTFTTEHHNLLIKMIAWVPFIKMKDACLPPPFERFFPTNPLPPKFFFSLWKEHFYENYQKQPFLAGFLYSPVDKTGLVLKEQLGFLGYACMGAK